MYSGTGCYYGGNLDLDVPYSPHQHCRAAYLSETPRECRDLTLGAYPYQLFGTRHLVFLGGIWFKLDKSLLFGGEVGEPW